MTITDNFYGQKLVRRKKTVSKLFLFTNFSSKFDQKHFFQIQVLAQLTAEIKSFDRLQMKFGPDFRIDKILFSVQ